MTPDELAMLRAAVPIIEHSTTADDLRAAYDAILLLPALLAEVERLSGLIAEQQAFFVDALVTGMQASEERHQAALRK